MSSVTFKCKQTGNTVTFRDAHDIDGMRKHVEYDEVKEQEVFPEEEQSLSQEEQPIKRMGRPKKEQ